MSAPEFDDRVAAIRTEIAAAHDHTSADGRPGHCAAGVDQERRRASLDALIASVVPEDPNVHAGLRGKLAGFAKKGVRRVIYWYVEPSWHAQQEIDQELARLANSGAEMIAALHSEIERLDQEVNRLQSWSVILQREAAVRRRDTMDRPRETE